MCQQTDDSHCITLREQVYMLYRGGKIYLYRTKRRIPYVSSEVHHRANVPEEYRAIFRSIILQLISVKLVLNPMAMLQNY